MTKLYKSVSSISFIILAVLIFYLLDTGLAARAPIENSTLFSKNDYEKTVISHENRTEYEKVFFGNSTLISAYIEEQSDSGFVNFGIDYGTVTDLYQMLNGKYLNVTDELVIYLNCFVLMDTLDTNPTYPWHKSRFEPYVFFQRDRIAPVAEKMFMKLMEGENPLEIERYNDMSKSVYYGVQTEDELKDTINRHNEFYWGLAEENYTNNLGDLTKVIQWCRENDVHLRVLWGPWNPSVDIPDNFAKVMELANDILNEDSIEILDMTNSVESKYFHDIGHLNYEVGAVYFTEVIDKWLLS